ncbi:MAG: 30S ribosomal protein S6--L-glutamate ligase [Gammaproteobacteria bacterium]|nr:30S ribosomal protein S6--L-glutamate ligase [Gammaproteobacteria bacterium]
MKIAILSRNKSLYSTRRLVEAATERGHEVRVIDYLRCYMNITAEQPSVQYKGHLLEAFDAIIPRIGANRTFYGTAILRQFETMGTYSINSSLSITRSRDKLRSQQLLVMKGVNMPATGFAHVASDINDLIDLVGGPPLIIKLIEGTQGVGVVLAETRKAAESVTQTLRGLKANIIMNIHRGGSAEHVRISKVEREAAIKAAKIMGLGMAGVDLIRSKRGPLILEINSSPGLEGIEAASEKDIAMAIIKHIEKNAKPIGPRSRYQG